MPDTLMYSQSQGYSPTDIGGGLVSGMMSAASSLMETKKSFPGALKLMSVRLKSAI